MILLVCLLLNIFMAVLYLKRYCKHVHKLEIAAYWIVGTLLVQNYSALNVMNFKNFAFPDILGLELAHFVNRTVFKPICFIWFLDLYIGMSSWKSRLVLAASFVAILTGLEWLEDGVGIFRHVHWKVMWSIASWAGAVLAAIVFMFFFRRKLENEVVSG